ncbi:hypothetical protein TL16_g07248 [Triparma laevis f. inornata]|uniref:PH domain-containing protein n=2 Tax=Triparma laevis TaxID=1534972 RepID=A0A9W7FE21_9STRA|nr:hypothetical protein TL16_g07248 [Triparma laevis f. inornata]GMI10450.1 hypothetical protein TrLO_g8339 [Triparma laevis f. longispina]
MSFGFENGDSVELVGAGRPSFVEDDEEEEMARIQDLSPMKLLWSGQLTKRGHQIKSWKNRYVEIRGGLFIYWRNELESSMGLVLETRWTNGYKKFYVKTDSRSQFIDAWNGMETAGKYSSNLIAHFDCGPSSQREYTAIGYMCAESCLFDDAIRAVNPRRNNLTQRESAIMGGCLYAKWRMGSAKDIEDVGLLNESLKHYETAMGGKQVTENIMRKLEDMSKAKSTKALPGKRTTSYEHPTDLNSSPVKIFQETVFNIATLHYLLGTTSGSELIAISEFNFLLERARHDFDKADILVNLALCYQSSGNMEKAKEDANKALNLVPNHQQAVLAVANLAAGEGNYVEAVEMYKRALESDPNEPSILVSLASSLLMQSDASADESAVEHLKYAVDLDSDVQGDAWEALIKCYNALGKFKEANAMKLQQGGSEVNSLKKRGLAFFTSL